MSKSPFLGSKVLDAISFQDVEPLIDKEVLYSSRWQFRKGSSAFAEATARQGMETWEKLKSEKIDSIYKKISAQVVSKKLIEPKIVYGYFECRRIGNGLLVTSGEKTFKFDFPREKKTPNRCIADFFKDGFIIFQVATVGSSAGAEAKKLFVENKFSEMFYLKGLAAEAAEAAAKYGHAYIRNELGAGANAGERFSPGYPSFPDLISQKKIMGLLKPERIGVRLTNTCMFIPEYTTSSIISVDCEAGLFNPEITI